MNCFLVAGWPTGWTHHVAWCSLKYLLEIWGGQTNNWLVDTNFTSWKTPLLMFPNLINRTYHKSLTLGPSPTPWTDKILYSLSDSWLFPLLTLVLVVSFVWDGLSSQGRVSPKPSHLNCHLPPLWALLSLRLWDRWNHAFFWAALAHYLTASVTLYFLSHFEVIYISFLLYRKPFQQRIWFLVPCSISHTMWLRALRSVYNMVNTRPCRYPIHVWYLFYPT